MNEVAELLAMIAQERIKALKRTVRIALAGPQGSGKSTAARAWAGSDPRVAHFSLDDVYLATAERKALAASVSPLFKARGAPGTHDLDLAKRTMMRLDAARGRDQTALPRFDKLKDARVPQELWPSFSGTPNVTLIEGWCMGAVPQEPDALAEPVNALERAEDAEGNWRGHANAQLAGPYAAYFDRFDAFVYLTAPDFEVVPRWRTEQEAELRGVAVDALPADIRKNLDRFVQHYERITRHMLDGGRRPGWVVQLDENRRIGDVTEPIYPTV
jgi:D-glycerate 3-kinase